MSYFFQVHFPTLAHPAFGQLDCFVLNFASHFDPLLTRPGSKEFSKSIFFVADCITHIWIPVLFGRNVRCPYVAENPLWFFGIFVLVRNT